MIPAPKTPHVSVIIPCYNQAHYLGEAVRSVLGQTCQDFEIIVVDDGSTDNTPQVVASFGKFVRYVYQTNAGLSAARNTGICATTSEYVGFLDADDLWLPDFLRTLVSILNRDQRFEAIYSGSQFVDVDGNLLPQKIMRTVSPDGLHDALIDGEFFPPCTVLARRSVFDKVGLFDVSLNASEDWDMWLRISEKFLFASEPRVLALYRMHGNNMSRDLNRMLESQLQVARKHFGSGEGDPSNWPETRQRAYAGIYLWQGLAYYQRKEPDLGSEYVRMALTTNPGITGSLDTFYMLSCAEQPPGYMGYFELADLERDANRVLTMLDTIFADPNTPVTLRSKRQVAYGMAFFALGLVAYGKRSLGQAREFLTRAVISRPSLLMDKKWILTFIKSLTGNRLLSFLLKWKRTRAISD